MDEVLRQQLEPYLKGIAEAAARAQAALREKEIRDAAKAEAKATILPYVGGAAAVGLMAFLLGAGAYLKVRRRTR